MQMKKFRETGFEKKQSTCPRIRDTFRNLRFHALPAVACVFVFSVSACSDTSKSDTEDAGVELDAEHDSQVEWDGESPDGNNVLGVVWEEIPGNPQIHQPACPAWNCLAHTDPWMAWDTDDNLLLWFSSGGSLGGPVVGRATVDDDYRVTLDPDDSPVLMLMDDVWDKYRETVSLKWDDLNDRWIMWYLGYEISFFDDPAFGQIYSTDREGIEWERADEPIYRPETDSWDFAFITSPKFLETPEGEWRLYYGGAGTTVGIGLLVSHDRGETWTPHPENPVFERELGSWDEGVLGCTVLILNGRYMMWYTGYEEPLDLETTRMYIGLAFSEDGIEWERSPLNPVVQPGEPGSWNDLRIVSPHIIVDKDGSLLMSAHGQSTADIGISLGKLGFWRSANVD